MLPWTVYPGMLTPKSRQRFYGWASSILVHYVSTCCTCIVVLYIAVVSPVTLVLVQVAAC